MLLIFVYNLWVELKYKQVIENSFSVLIIHLYYIKMNKNYITKVSLFKCYY